MARRPRTPALPSAAPPAGTPAAVPRRSRGLGPARHGGQGRVYTSKPASIEFAAPEHRLNRADLEISGIYHGEASYEGRVFLNNPKADQTTARTPENGYAGSFYVFGHGGCLGDAGHCEVQGHREPYDFRNPHPLTLAKKRVDVTKAVQEAARTDKEATVTIVPVITAANELCDTNEVFRFEAMRLVSYNP
jgi:hypothetical protein